MNADKIRNLTEEELAHQERDLADQLFKLKFQLNMGQTESLKKIRGLRKDIARVKTIQGERGRGAVSVTTASATAAGATKKSATRKSATRKSATRKSATKKSATKASATEKR
jgi:large subunit ribosomal protein L29